jgi:NAD(P)-dependent dehydrogenase (short-subunit alcohol dehydrogenase family)
VVELTGITAVVTGAASGLGAAAAARLIGEGARVLGLDLASAIEKVERPVDGIVYAAADVTDPVAVADALALLDDFDAPLRVVVNCAGIAPGRKLVSSRGAHDLELFATTLAVNAIGTFNVMRLGAERMSSVEPVDGERGVIVNTASIAAFEGQIGQVAYAASKAAVVGMTLPAARDLAEYGIRVVTVAPGTVDTPMMAGMSEDVRSALGAGVPFPQRLALPTEYADLVVFLARHGYMNGETVRMDGALRMAPR